MVVGITAMPCSHLVWRALSSIESSNEDVRRMRTLLKIVLVAVCAAILTTLLGAFPSES